MTIGLALFSCEHGVTDANGLSAMLSVELRDSENRLPWGFHDDKNGRRTSHPNP